MLLAWNFSGMIRTNSNKDSFYTDTILDTSEDNDVLQLASNVIVSVE